MTPRDLARSRTEILQALGTPHDITLVHGPGNVRSEIARRGAQGLLEGRRYEQVGSDELARVSGHTALIAVGEGLCRPDHRLAARVLGVAELRFERVIMLPLGIDADEDEVRDALMRTAATVFCAEPESHRQIASLCDARVVHHCAFFLDYEAHRGSAGRPQTLNAFRTDSEQPLDRDLPPDNDDISLTRTDPDAWLTSIAGHERICTDRAAVMIAGAMLGRRVEYLAEFDPSLAALAEHSLCGLPVSMIPPARSSRRDRAPDPAALAEHADAAVSPLLEVTTLRQTRRPKWSPRVTAVIVSRNRPRLAVRALNSLQGSDAPAQTIVLDNNSSPVRARALAAACRDRDRVTYLRLARNTGAGVGRQLGAGLVDTELLAFLDDDAEFVPGALSHLVADLDAHPEVSGVTATTVYPNGCVMHSGGQLSSDAETVTFDLVGGGLAVDSVQLAPSGPAGWIPTTAMLARTELLREFPMDAGMRAYFEDNEWGYRIAMARPGSFRRSREALAVHQSRIKPVGENTFAGRSLAVEWLASLARFYELHGRLMAPWVFGLMPMLWLPDGSWDYSAARLLMELILERGTDWLFAAWLNGGLAGLMQVNSYG